MKCLKAFGPQGPGDRAAGGMAAVIQEETFTALRFEGPCAAVVGD